MDREFILCSAIHYKNGAESTVDNIESGVIICGRRHGDCYGVLKGIRGDDVDFSKEPDRDEQGFLTSKNRFVGREEAFRIAKANNQIIHKMFDKDNKGTLASEDLY
jgi:hypothetical protein